MENKHLIGIEILRRASRMEYEINAKIATIVEWREYEITAKTASIVEWREYT